MFRTILALSALPFLAVTALIALSLYHPDAFLSNVSDAIFLTPLDPFASAFANQFGIFTKYARECRSATSMDGAVGQCGKAMLHWWQEASPSARLAFAGSFLLLPLLLLLMLLKNLIFRSASPTVPLSGSCAVAISWDHNQSEPDVDVDLQAVVVDGRGKIIAAVFHNNLKAIKNSEVAEDYYCITHSGDATTTDERGGQEVIRVDLSRFPADADVRELIFVIATHTGRLRDVKNGKIKVLKGSGDKEVACFPMENSVEEVDVVLKFIRKPDGTWTCMEIDEPAQDGRHFMDILEPTLGNLIRKDIAGAPETQTIDFAMEKGACIDLPLINPCIDRPLNNLPPSASMPKGISMSNVSACLGWDKKDCIGVDVDLSAVLFDNTGGKYEAVYFHWKEAAGLKHSGDNLTGEGDGDDEIIQCDLAQIPEWVQQILFVVTVYTTDKTFQDVSNAYIRMLDNDGNEFAKYSLQEAQERRGLIHSRLYKHGTEFVKSTLQEEQTEKGLSRWGFQALGEFVEGPTWRDVIPDMKRVLAKGVRDMQ